MIAVHSVPMISIALNCLLTDVVFVRNHGKYLVYIGVSYLAINFVATKMRGSPIYFFLPWNDGSSVVVATAIVGGALWIFSTIVWLTEFLKGRTSL